MLQSVDEPASSEPPSTTASANITIVVPTRNRAFTLQLVATSYFEQALVDEIIFVDDAGSDDTGEVIAGIAKGYPSVSAVVVRNSSRLGAARSRNVGVGRARNKYILFCDDDEYLEAGYARTCLEKLKRYDAGAVSGRRVYMQAGETEAAALKRFGNGLRSAKPFHYSICEMVNGARFEGDRSQPFSNAVILTRRDLVRKFPFDGHYARGTGYREETDYQMNLYVNGYSIYISNDTHSIHLPLSQVRSGGQRTSRLRRIYWAIFYTRYFYAKYYDDYANRTGLLTPKWLALLEFSAFVIYRETVRPLLHEGIMRLRAWRQERIVAEVELRQG
ncbi:MAG TPA: glycosyltransferase family 2 protein [Hyphomicrobium sp.]|nr:glycosyltransferase family 2 protein [Hyphomicrobium sp.]